MKIWKTIVLTLSASICMAEEIQQGKIYSGGTYLESNQTGIGLTIPSGWQGAWPQGSQMFVLESSDLKANIFMAFDQGDEAGLKAMMSNTIPLDASIQLLPVSPPKKQGKVYTANYSVAGAPQLSGYIAAQILPTSVGVALIALSANASKRQQVEQITLKLANSLTVKKPAASPSTAHSSAPSDTIQWKEYFKGRYIVRYFSGSGYREVQHLWLCSDGRFLRKFDSGSSSMSGATGASISRGKGHWTATNTTAGEGQLILQLGTGSSTETITPGTNYSTSNTGGKRWVYRVSLGKALLLDGKKWLSTKNKVCN